MAEELRETLPEEEVLRAVEVLPEDTAAPLLVLADERSTLRSAPSEEEDLATDETEDLEAVEAEALDAEVVLAAEVVLTAVLSEPERVPTRELVRERLLIPIPVRPVEPVMPSRGDQVKPLPPWKLPPT